MFKKILIANRGEIACRVIRTARGMGIATVAVYSEADARALHVDMANEKVMIGPAPAAQSYLAIDKILDACRRAGADAVHPGYGFLSERTAFAEALVEAGIAFIGPHAKAIAAMGDKIASKKAAAAAGVATVPGYLDVIADAGQAMQIAQGIGFPVMLKASAGGGGKGMRIAWSNDEVREGFERAQAEALASFGDGRMFIEKFIVDPRHIEIQVLGDKHGNVIHLGERECSIQRRNQKVIEEAPSPLLDARTRRAMGEQAVALAKAVGYDSAGTVEFVVSQDKQFFFLEMNTRLQVEHPVTELVTGVDIVEHMIRSAAGERLSLKQSDVRLEGSAIECRVCAEDPSRDFAPSTGRLVKYRPPPVARKDGITVRNDTGVEEGGEVPIWYDSLIAKLCTHAATRADAIAAMARCLDEFHIDGIRSNLQFLAAIMAHPRWREGKLSTGFIAEEFAGGFVGAPVSTRAAHDLAAIACFIDHVENARRRKVSGQMSGRQVAFSRERRIRVGDGWHDVEILHEQGIALEIKLADQVKAIASSWRPGEPVWRGHIEGRELAANVQSLANGYRIGRAGIMVDTVVYTRREAELAALMPVKSSAGRSAKMRCPIPGIVIAVHVSEGAEVKVGDGIAVIEAMKMQNLLRAERDGIIKTLHIKAGDSLGVDAVILEFA